MQAIQSLTDGGGGGGNPHPTCSVFKFHTDMAAIQAVQSVATCQIIPAVNGANRAAFLIFRTKLAMWVKYLKIMTTLAGCNPPKLLCGMARSMMYIVQSAT